MQLVYIERTTAETDDTRLTRLLEARAKAAERCVEANQHASTVRRDLITHLSRRLVEGASSTVLRKAMLDSGIEASKVGDLMRAAEIG